MADSALWDTILYAGNTKLAAFPGEYPQQHKSRDFLQHLNEVYLSAAA